jgi:hypothetical protein
LRDESLSKAGRTVYNWLPIFGETTEQVLDWHWNNQMPLHPVYVREYHQDGTTGGYLRRFSSRVCIFATDHDVCQIYTHDREAFDLISDLERKIGFTMKAGQMLIQIASAPAEQVKGVQPTRFVRLACGCFSIHLTEFQIGDRLLFEARSGSSGQRLSNERRIVMHSGRHVIDEKPDWSPLEILFGMDVNLIGQFMHMGRIGTLQLYKHRDSRRYLHIDAESGVCYEESGLGFVQISKAQALRRVFAECC